MDYLRASFGARYGVETAGTVAGHGARSGPGTGSDQTLLLLLLLVMVLEEVVVVGRQDFLGALDAAWGAVALPGA